MKTFKNMLPSALALCIGLVAGSTLADDAYSDRLSELDLQRLKAFIGEPKTTTATFKDELDKGDRYRVQPGDTLSGIFQRFYGNTNINKEVLQAVFVKVNKTAFRRGNPNWLMAGSILKFPSGTDVVDYVVDDKAVADTNVARRDDWISFP